MFIGHSSDKGSISPNIGNGRANIGILLGEYTIASVDRSGA